MWFVPHYWGNTSLTIRTDLAPEYAKSQSWDILFDPKYKGRVSVLDGVDDTVPFIAHMIGIDAYHMSRRRLDEGAGQAARAGAASALGLGRRHRAGAGAGVGRDGGGDELARQPSRR